MQTTAASISSAEVPLAKKQTRRAVPDFLIREVVEGVPFYYPGFRSVLNKTKKMEDVMADSVFQSTLKNEIGDFLKSRLNRKQYRVLSGETGLHIGPRNNLGLDIVVYDKSILTPDKVVERYADVPAELVVEIDVKVEVDEKEKDLFNDFVVPKTKRLLAFGTKKVVWYFSRTRTVLVAESSQKWTIQEWREPVELLPGVVLDIYRLMEEGDIILEGETPGGAE
jgi:Uma2 family endonuclease